MVSPERDHHFSRTPSRLTQRDSRSGIPHPEIINGMDVRGRSIQEHSQYPGPYVNRFVCLSVEQPVSEVCQLASQPICGANRCLPNVVAGGDRVCFPSFCSDWQMSPKGVAGGLHGDSGRFDMGHTTMFPGTPGAANRLPNSATRRRITSEGPIQQGSSPIGDKTAAVSRLEGLRKSHTAEGISGRASELLLSVWNKGTNATYQSGWNSWCDEREIDPISCDVRCFLDF